MTKCFALLAFLFFSVVSIGAPKNTKSDSIKIAIELLVKDKKIETAKNFWNAYYNLEVQLKMFGFIGGKKHLYKTFPLVYDVEDELWEVTVPQGFFELEVNSFGFKDIRFPIRTKVDFKESFTLEVDSLSYTYKNGLRYNYIAGTLNFNETIVVAFKDGDYATNRAFLDEALAIEGLEHINVRRALKMPNKNAFIVTLDIWDTKPLSQILYDKLMDVPQVERGFLIGGHITKAIELYQANPSVIAANPTFIGDPEQTFWRSDTYKKSEYLERKLENYRVEDDATLKKINYIIKRTTPPVLETDQE